MSTSSQSNFRLFTLIMLTTFLGVITARLVATAPLKSANDRSRWCTVYSIVEKNTYQIDEIRKQSGWDTIDLVKHNDHFYSTKPPLLPRIVAEIYRAVKTVTGLTLLKNTEAVTRIILFIINIVPMTIALWMMFGLIQRHCENAFGQYFLAAAITWATLLVPFLTVFNNHTIGASFLIYSLVLGISILVEEKVSGWRFAVCGLTAAFAVCNELPAAAYGLILFFLLVRKYPSQTWSLFVPAALVPIGLFMLTNYHATGGWKPFYMYYGTEKYRFIHEGKPSYWMDPQGIDQAKESPLTYFMHCTIGHHGILSLTPVFVLTVLSWLSVALWWKNSLRNIHIAGMMLTAIVLGFYMTKTDNYNYGGVSVALRWMLWLIPFWILAVLPLMNRFGMNQFFRGLCVVLLLPSLFSAWYPADAPWTQPWIFQVMESKGWIDYSTPRPKFDRKYYSWIGELPTGELDEDYWAEFSTVTTDGATQTLRLEDAGPADDGWRAVRVVLNGEATEYLVYRPTMLKGLPPADYIKARDGGALTEEQLKFFYGVPKRRAYASSRVRYIDNILKTDAIKSHIGYTYVDVEQPEGELQRFQRDVWFSSEVPFGVFQWEDRVSDPKSKAQFSRAAWSLDKVGKFLPRDGEADSQPADEE
ncbi:hypothetical protein AB1L42_10655 [Thalassoglobus sp. JC818]|uniref:hypothetical protein n=1 Tax=Thalassoglobus sp. JC818 TaxID=3232136 RepID=UPI003459BE9D